MPDSRDVESRLGALERELAALRAEVEQLRAMPAGVSASASTVQPSAGARLSARLASSDLEGLVGRYGMLALATIMALAAVGTFLGWAIAHGLLGPRARLALGMAVAGVLAIAGARIRRRERSFGASLLGLALAITHLCAWAAAPLLHVVSGSVAFGVAAAASVILAAFAQAEGDEPVWCVGFGGAALAPFVTATGSGSVPLLAGYGVLVLLAAGWALRGRAWPIAEWVYAATVALYTGALASMPEAHNGPLFAVGVPLVAGAVGVLPFALVERVRGRLRPLGVLAALAVVRAGLGTGYGFRHATIAGILAGATVVWLILADACGDAPIAHVRHPSESGTSARAWIDTAWVPTAMLAGIVLAFNRVRPATAWPLIGGAVLLTAFAARRTVGALRDGAAFAGVVSGAAAVVWLANGHPDAMAAAMAGVGVAAVAADRAWASVSWRWMAALVLLAASVEALWQLVGRVNYGYTPFLTGPSDAALGVAVGWAAAALVVRAGTARDAFRLGAWSWGFVWVRQELAFAVSPTVSTLLLVSYYAVASVVAVGAGRMRSLALVRHAGLALGVLAAFTALGGVRHLSAVAARIGGYLVVSVFLMAIAWWYRRPGTDTSAAPGAAMPTATGKELNPIL